MSGNDSESGPALDNVTRLVPKKKISKEFGKTLCNFEMISNGSKDVKFGRSIADLWDKFKEYEPDWPKRYQDNLFFDNGESVSRYSGAPALFGWLLSRGIAINWNDSCERAITKAEFRQVLLERCERIDAIHDYPHFPSLGKKHYYRQHQLGPANGMLDRLVDMFNPATPEDRILIKAMFITPFWGGFGGTRPAFVITTDTAGDPLAGRGAGKTSLSEAVGQLCGGAVEASVKDEISGVIKRILTAGNKRVVRFDNVKSWTLNNGDLEGLITTANVSGHRLHVGHGETPNLYTYIFTFNDSGLSKDLAQRAVIIKVKRPPQNPTWWTAVSDMIENHRWEIVSDIKALFERPQDLQPGPHRFQHWAKEVLYRCGGNEHVLNLAATRVQEADSEANEAEEIAETIRAHLAEYVIDLPRKGMVGQEYRNANPHKDVFLIKSGVLMEWVKEHFGSRAANNRISRKLKTINVQNLMPYSGKIMGDSYWVWGRILEDEQGGFRGYRISNLPYGEGKHVALHRYGKGADYLLENANEVKTPFW